jgi:hypothetical protein
MKARRMGGIMKIPEATLAGNSIVRKFFEDAPATETGNASKSATLARYFQSRRCVLLGGGSGGGGAGAAASG